MTLDALIMLLGAFVALLPFLGFPVSWDSVILVICGVLVIFLGIIVRRRGLIRRIRAPRKSASAYVESAPQPSSHETA